MRAGDVAPWALVGRPARVAAVAALLIAVLFTCITVPFDVIGKRQLVGNVDTKLTAKLHALSGASGSGKGAAGQDDHDGDDTVDVDDAPILQWWAPAARSGAETVTKGAPPLTGADWAPTTQATTATLDGHQFRTEAARQGGGWVIVGQSLSAANHVESVVVRAELLTGPSVVLAVFLGALAIGVMASRPVEQARRRQLEFTADASHELRTPLTVIEAEVSLALGSDRGTASYRGALERVGTESKRLRHIIEDLLFLARFDAMPPDPGYEEVDLGTVAEECARRFTAVAEASGIALSVARDGAAGALLLQASPQWLDRLCGVLVDNACRYAGEGGRVQVTVSARGNVVKLCVEDSGPGIPDWQRPFLFDRFHRGPDGAGGAGLGLAIADAVVRSTGGRWQVTNGPKGGAHIEVAWRRHQARNVAQRDKIGSGARHIPAVVDSRGPA